MSEFLIAAFIGIVAGILDIIPMIVQKLDKRYTISAFVHYFALGLIIPFVDWRVAPWIEGISIAIATAIPIMIIVYPKDKTAMVPMTISALVLGAGIGIAGAILIT